MPPSLIQTWRDKYPALGYLAPFFTLLLLIALPKPAAFVLWEWPVQVAVVGAVCYLTWPGEISLRARHWIASIALGLAVFFLWIGPDVLFPHYRQGILFSNSLFHVGSSMRSEALSSNWVLFWRTVRASTVVPLAEELFWRGWLMRWIANPDFRKIPLGAYAPAAFWLTAALFAVEHGAYWDVGFLTGAIYNFWMVRTKSVADCILAHAVTNLVLSLYVIKFGQWQYWQ